MDGARCRAVERNQCGSGWGAETPPGAHDSGRIHRTVPSDEVPVHSGQSQVRPCFEGQAPEACRCHPCVKGRLRWRLFEVVPEAVWFPNGSHPHGVGGVSACIDLSGKGFLNFGF